MIPGLQQQPEQPRVPNRRRQDEFVAGCLSACTHTISIATFDHRAPILMSRKPFLGVTAADTISSLGRHLKRAKGFAFTHMGLFTLAIRKSSATRLIKVVHTRRIVALSS